MQVMFNYSDVYNIYFRGRHCVESNEEVMKRLKGWNKVDNTRNYG